MANNTFNNFDIMFNSIADQKLTAANTLTVKAWNDIITILKTQANINATYLSSLNKWLIGNDPVSIPSSESFVDYINTYISEMPNTVMDIVNKNSLGFTTIDIGYSTNYNIASDKELPTTKAVGKIVNELGNKKADKSDTYTKTEVDDKEYDLNRRIDDTYTELESMIEESRNEIEDRENLISIIGNATETLAGVMSAKDKKNLNTLVALLQDDENNVVDTIKEVLAIFEQYPEGANLVSALASKADKADTYNKAETDNLLATKVNMNTYEIHLARTENIEKQLIDKADKSDTYTKTEVDNKLTRSKLISTIGNATESLAGVMSAEDKKNLNTLVTFIREKGGTNDVVDTIAEVLAIFNQYPEGVDLVSVLADKVNETTYNAKVEELEENISDLDNIKIEIDSLTAKNNIKNYQEVLWLGSDEIPEIPTHLPEGSSDLETYLTNLKTIWTDIETDSIKTYGYDRVVFLGCAKSIKKMVKCTIRYYESSGTYALNVHSSIYKANVKECISLNTNKRYKLVNDTYETPQEPSYFLEETSGYSKSEVDNLIAGAAGGGSVEVDAYTKAEIDDKLGNIDTILDNLNGEVV